MKIFSIVVGDKGEVKLAGDLELVQVKQVVESILLQQISQQWYNKGQAEERNKIRQGFKSRRNQTGYNKGKEEKNDKENQSSTEESREENLQKSS